MPIIEKEFAKAMNGRQLSRSNMAISSIMSCLLVSLMPRPYFKDILIRLLLKVRYLYYYIFGGYDNLYQRF